MPGLGYVGPAQIEGGMVGDDRAQVHEKYSAQEIIALGKARKALLNPDGSYSFPVADREDLENGIRAVGGRAQKSSPERVRVFLMERARALGTVEPGPVELAPRRHYPSLSTGGPHRRRGGSSDRSGTVPGRRSSTSTAPCIANAILAHWSTPTLFVDVQLSWRPRLDAYRYVPQMSSAIVANGRATTSIKSPLTYQLRGDHSFFTDLLRVSQRNEDAVERMHRHQREMADQRLERRGASGQPEGVEFRAPNASVPPNSTTAGGGGSFAPPLWVVELEATAPRPERIVSDLIDPYPLPDGIGSINVPLLTTGTATAQEQPNAPVASQDIADAAASCPVVQIAGQADVPIQMLEQSPKGSWEATLLRDLQADYDAKLEAKVISGAGGTGPTGTILGLTNVGGTNSIAYTDADPTGTAMYPSFGKAFGVVSDTRKIRPKDG